MRVRYNIFKEVIFLMMLNNFINTYLLLILVCLPILWYTYDRAESFFTFYNRYKSSQPSTKESYKGLYWSAYYGCDLVAIVLFFIGIYCGVLTHYGMCLLWVMLSGLITLYSLNISRIIVYGAMKIGPTKGGKQHETI